ncbi:MAG: alpha-xylosidase [Chloroflexi bacterium]|nr:alpha-xylosidase [Chloroflexota bacterium]
MKFSDGYWEVPAGYKPLLAAQAYDIQTADDNLTVYAPTKVVNGRGDTLNQPVITFHYSSPMENVIKVRMYHHKGRVPKGPSFEIKPQPAPEVTVTSDEQGATLTSGRLSVRVNKGKKWLVEFKDGDKVITGSGWRAAGVVDTPDGRFAHEQLDLDVGELVYGLGERFTPFVKNGQIVEIWNEDGGTSSQQSYKNVPFYMTNRGYGVFINHTERVSMEVGSENVERVQFSVAGEELEYFVIYGPSPKEVLERYTALLGRPALPPAWSFGLWLTTSFTTYTDEEVVNSFIQGMADRKIPLSVFHVDSFWMKEFNWVDFKWNKQMFPDPVALIARLKSFGLHICQWINPYVAQQSSMFDEGVAGGYLVKRPNGDIWQWDMWQAGMAIVDFTNPAACEWFASKLREQIDLGIDSFKTDFGERIPTEAVFFDGSDPLKMHNYYTYLYNKTVFETLLEKRGEGEALVFARSGTAGSQQFPLHWAGDNTGSYASMAETLRGGLSLALSGFSFWSHDISGFEWTATPDLYKRWSAFGLMSSHSRLHGNESYRVPWVFDDEASDVLRFFTNLKCRLMPYLFDVACQSHQTGVPFLRPMLLEFPEDPTCDFLDRQYMLGDALLAAPVFSPKGDVEYYLPAGRWTRFLTGEVVEGGRWLRENHGYFSMPILVRPNSVVAVGNNEDRPDYDYPSGVTLHVFELEDGREAAFSVPTQRGKAALTGVVSRQGQEIRVEVQVGTQGWQVLLRGISSVESVNGGQSQASESGTLLTPGQDSTRLTVRLAAV